MVTATGFYHLHTPEIQYLLLKLHKPRNRLVNEQSIEIPSITIGQTFVCQSFLSFEWSVGGH